MPPDPRSGGVYNFEIYIRFKAKHVSKKLNLNTVFFQNERTEKIRD